MKLTFQLHKSVDFIFDYLTDMQKFCSVHPVIYRIVNNGNEDYTIYEQLKFGFIPFSFTYATTVKKNQVQKQVSYHASVIKLVNIKMNFVLKPAGERTIVEEEIQFKSILPVKFIMNNIFEKQHTQLFKNIEMC